MSTKTHKDKDKSVAAIQAESSKAVAHVAPEFDYSEYAGQGFENHTKDDYAMPFLGIVQANSPIIETVASAKPGAMFNTVTQQIFDGKAGLAFLPVKTEHKVIEWKPRTLGGGFVGTHEFDNEFIEKVKAEQEFGKWKVIKGDINSNDLVETFYVYGIAIDENGFSSPMVIGFTSTKIKSYKNWMNKANAIQMKLPNGRIISSREFPIYAHRYRLTTTSQKNAKGSFYNFNIALDGEDATAARLPTNDTYFIKAREFFQLLGEGEVKVAHETQTQTTEVEEAEIPFK